MNELKVVNVVGARPNFMKVAPIYERMRERTGIEPFIVHTGQHYDRAMSELFFEHLGLPDRAGNASLSFQRRFVSILRSLDAFLRRGEDLEVVDQRAQRFAVGDPLQGHFGSGEVGRRALLEKLAEGLFVPDEGRIFQ